MSGGPNLRGSLNSPRDRRPGTSTSTNVNVTVDKDPRFTLEKVPQIFAEYPLWLFKARGKILGCGIPVGQAKKYLRLMELDEEELPTSEVDVVLDTEHLENVDTKFYSEIISAMSGLHNDHLITMQTEVKEGSGLQALRVLNRLMNYQSHRVIARSGTTLINRTCRSMPLLVKFVQDTRGDLNSLKTRKQPMPSQVAYEMMKKALDPFTPNGPMA